MKTLDLFRGVRGFGGWETPLSMKQQMDTKLVQEGFTGISRA